MEHKAWFERFRKSEDYDFLQKKPLAYFCAEYALSDDLPTYAGGLGVLAGDYIRELADQKIPAVAVGLFYHSKYGTLEVQEVRKPLNAPSHGVKPVLDAEGKPLVVQIPILDHEVFAKAWLWQDNSIPVYLLDTNIEENSVPDRQITHQIYTTNKETRLKQEMVLGIGGFRLLEALGVQPSIYHMNEGHSALLALEIIRHEMQKRYIGFEEARALSIHHVIFTNHTLIPAGSEIYSNELFTTLLNRYASELEVPVTEIAALGSIRESNNFSMTLFALNLAGKINAVSRLHGKEAAKTWPDHIIDYVTNGIYLPRWDSLGEFPIPARNATHSVVGGSNFKFPISNEAQKDIWNKHQENKRELLSLIKKETGEEWGENTLLLGWARRMVRYKRPLALFGEIDRFIEITTNSNKPVRVVMAGVAHQSDFEGREFIETLKQLFKKELHHLAVFLPNYNTTLAKILTSGCDIWLNTPVVGSEACGTSGMKACLNGVLPCSTKDGWVEEVDLIDVGWEVDSNTVHDSLFDVLNTQVIPAYYTKDKKEWTQYMQNGRELISKKFSTTRMLKEYFEKLYLPILTSSYTHYSS